MLWGDEIGCGRGRGYLEGLPQDRREALSAMRTVILDRSPEGYAEERRWGTISS